MEKYENQQRSEEKLRIYASFLDVQDEREKDIFRFLVSECGGCIDLERLKEKYSPLPGDFDHWLSKEKKILSFYKKNGRIIYILPFLRDATFCADHLNPMTKCELENCDRFHVCKYYLNDHCSYAHRCKNGHTFTVGNNKEIKHKLGLSAFQDDEIRVILKCRYPQVCPAAHCESVLPDECPYLHVCYMFTQGKCKDPSCDKGHSLEDPHNKWVLSVYEMENWPKERPELFKALITLRRKALQGNIQDDRTSITYLRQPVSTLLSLDMKENERETTDSLLEELVIQMKEEKRKEEND